MTLEEKVLMQEEYERFLARAVEIISARPTSFARESVLSHLRSAQKIGAALLGSGQVAQNAEMSSRMS